MTQRMRKQNTNKGKKTLSKNPELSRDKNTYSYKQLQQAKNMSPISYLQKRLNDQINIRQQSYNELLEMIKHLEETKKSKVPIDFDNNAIRRLLNPNIRLNTGPSVQSQQLIQFKAQVGALKSNKNNELQKQNKVLKQIIKEVKEIKQQMVQNEKYRSKKLVQQQKNQTILKNIQLELQIKELKQQLYLSQIQRNKAYKKTQYEDIQIKIKQIFQQIAAIKEQLSQKQKKTNKKEQQPQDMTILRALQDQINLIKDQLNQNRVYNTNLVHFLQQFKIFKEDVFDNQKYLNDKMQGKNVLSQLYQKMGSQYLLISSLSSQVNKIQMGLESFSAVFGKMDSSMKIIQDRINAQFQSITNQVAKASKSINQTKSHFQQILYGESKDKKDKKDHNSKIPLKGQTQAQQKIIHIEARMQSLERRVDLIYKQYFNKPLKVKD